MPDWGRCAAEVTEDNVAASDATVPGILGAMLALSHSKPAQAESLMQAAGKKKTSSDPSLYIPCFKTVFCCGVASGCLVVGASPSSLIWRYLVPKRGPEGLGLAFRRVKSAHKMRAKSFGPWRSLAGSEFPRVIGSSPPDFGQRLW